MVLGAVLLFGLSDQIPEFLDQSHLYEIIGMSTTMIWYNFQFALLFKKCVF